MSNRDYYAAKTHKCMTEIKLCLDILDSDGIDLETYKNKLEELKTLLEQYGDLSRHYRSETIRDLDKITNDFVNYVTERIMITTARIIAM